MSDAVPETENPETDPINDAWPPKEPEDAAMNTDGTPKTASASGRKAFVDLEGSYEDTQADLEQLLDEWLNEMLPDVCAWIWVEATFDDHIIAGVGCDPDGDMCGNVMAPPGADTSVEYWSIPYERDGETDVYTFGAPTPVDVQGVAVPRSSASGPGFTVMDFLSGEKVIQRSLATKNSTRRRRRYLLLADEFGQDISSTGLTATDLENASGVGDIPGAGTPSYLDDVTDTNVAGANTNLDTDGAAVAAAAQTAAGDQPSPAIPSWYQGTWYLDNAGNLQPVGLNPAVVDQPAGDVRAAAIPDQGTYLDNVGEVPGVVDQGPALVAVAATAVGALDLSPGKSLRGRRPPRRTVLSRMRAAYSSAPGAGGRGTAPATSSPAQGMINDEQIAQLSERIPEAVKAVTSMLAELKAGRVLSASNAERVQNAHAAIGSAHAALTELLAQAGVDPLHPTTAAPNTTSGYDEEGVPIEVDDAKGGETRTLRVKGLSEVDLMAWQNLKSAPV